MVMLCFVLDLRTLSPPSLRHLKQSLLQLANFYAISAPINEGKHSKPLRDRIGLCYIFKNRISCANELKVAYCPRGNFCLRDFHHAVNNLPNDAFFLELNNSGALCCDDLKLPSILSDKVLYSWLTHGKDIARKVIVISSCLVENLDSITKKSLMDAADKFVSVEFILLEQKSSHLGDLPENINNFVKHICDLENCSFQTYLPDAQVLCALVKRWLQELKDDMEEQLQARFIFKGNLGSSLSQISCTLFISFNRIIDNFLPCQACRCHGIPLDDEQRNKAKRSTSCPVTGNDLGEFGLIKNSVKVGEQTILFMPSFQCSVMLPQVSSPIDINVIKRTNLGSLNEGVILGTSYIITPTCHESDDNDKSELNTQLFQGLCSALHSLDQGLICSSNSNMETGGKTPFQCYYILLPSDNGRMLLRRLAGSEEILPLPDVNQLIDSTVAKEIENSVRASLLKMEVSDYNPVLHERGFHQKLNLLVKESLQLGSLPPKLEELTSEPNLTQKDSSEEARSSKQSTDVIAIEEEIPQLDLKAGEDKITMSLPPKLNVLTSEPNSIQQDSSEEALPSKKAAGVIEEEIPLLDLKAGEDKTTALITEEWEQLIVNEIPKIHSPTCISKPKLDQVDLSPADSNRQLDEKTSRILERLEAPRQLKTKTVSPIISSSATTDVCVLRKKPLIPFAPIHAADHGLSASQPMKPNFQRLKRKQR